MAYDFTQLDKELRLMDYIGGLEVKYTPIFPLWIETFRRVEGLYEELCIARLNLLMAAKAVYPNLIEKGKNSIGDRIMQNSFAQTSIIWYNNCFDLLLQVIWVRYKVWTYNPKIKVSATPSDWTRNQIDLMKEYKYQYEVIKEWNANNANKVAPIIKLHNSTFYIQVHKWTNEIKHRAPLQVKGHSLKSPIRSLHFKHFEQSTDDKGKIAVNIELDNERYDSGNAFEEYDIDVIISTLIDYHKELCNCIDLIAKPIIEEYKNHTE